MNFPQIQNDQIKIENDKEEYEVEEELFCNLKDTINRAVKEYELKQEYEFEDTCQNNQQIEPIIMDEIIDLSKQQILSKEYITGICFIELENKKLVAIFYGLKLHIYSFLLQDKPELLFETILQYVQPDQNQKNGISIIKGSFGFLHSVNNNIINNNNNSKISNQKSKQNNKINTENNDECLALITGSDNGEVFTVQLQNDFPCIRRKIGESPVTNILSAFENDNFDYRNIVAIQTQDTKFYLYNFSKDIIIARFRHGIQLPGYAVSLEFMINGKYLFVANSDSSFEFWKISKNVKLKINECNELDDKKKDRFSPYIEITPFLSILNVHKQPIQHACLYYNLVLSVDIEGCIKLWALDIDHKNFDTFLIISEQQLHTDHLIVNSFNVRKELVFQNEFSPKLMIGLNKRLSVLSLEEDQLLKQNYFIISNQKDSFSYATITEDQSQIFAYHDNEFYYYTFK